MGRSDVSEYRIELGSKVELFAHSADLAAVNVSISFEQLQNVVSVARATRVELQGDEMRHVDHGKVVARNACRCSANRGLTGIVGSGPRVVEVDHLYRVEILASDAQDPPKRIFRIRQDQPRRIALLLHHSRQFAQRCARIDMGCEVYVTVSSRIASDSSTPRPTA